MYVDIVHRDKRYSNNLKYPHYSDLNAVTADFRTRILEMTRSEDTVKPEAGQYRTITHENAVNLVVGGPGGFDFVVTYRFAPHDQSLRVEHFIGAGSICCEFKANTLYVVGLDGEPHVYNHVKKVEVTSK